MEDADAGDHAVGGQIAGLAVGEQTVLDEDGLGVEEPRDALAHRQLALLGELLASALGATRSGAPQPLLDLGGGVHAARHLRVAGGRGDGMRGCLSHR